MRRRADDVPLRVSASEVGPFSSFLRLASEGVNNLVPVAGKVGFFHREGRNRRAKGAKYFIFKHQDAGW
jgi:hypothetical protein